MNIKLKRINRTETTYVTLGIKLLHKTGGVLFPETLFFNYVLQDPNKGCKSSQR